MLLAIDVGNTNIVLAVFDGEALKGDFSLATTTERTADEFVIALGAFFGMCGIGAGDIEAVYISSVVPQVTGPLSGAVRKYLHLEPYIVSGADDIGIKILYDNPAEVGADRIVNAYAAREIYGAPVIIVDFGTATTFCVVSREGHYLGGAICPGLKISMDALFGRTAKLPRVEMKLPPRVIGKNTVESIQSGIINGHLGQIEYIIRKIKEEIGEPECKVVAAGGLSRTIGRESPSIDIVDGLLTLKGLRLIYERRQRRV